MNDLNLIDSFNTKIEELLKSGLIEPEIASDENSKMLILAQELATYDTRNKSRVEKSLRMELIARINNKEALPSKTLPQATSFTMIINSSICVGSHPRTRSYHHSTCPGSGTGNYP